MNNIELLAEFLEWAENNYYYNSGGWVNYFNDQSKSYSDIAKEFLDQKV